MDESSVGEVETNKFHYDENIELESGRKFGPIDVAYETYGELNKDRSNAVLICHALTGDAHAAGWHDGDEKPGWWDNMIGPGKAFDTDKYFVISSNVLGGCQGTTGPSSINPETGEPYGLNFPVITVKDMITVQKKLLEHLGVDRIFAVAGGSLGGMQALQWAVTWPERVKFVIPIATTAQSTPQQIALDEVRRRAIMSDPKWNEGDYYGDSPPEDGLRLARMIGHITYLSDTSMKEKFGRKLQGSGKFNFDLDVDFEVENYLHYKGGSFVERFDANSYLYLTKAVDYFDLTNGGERSLMEAFSNVKSKFLVISITSDWLYPTYQSKQIVKALESNSVDVTYSEITSTYGHDAFFLEPGQLHHMVANFLSQVLVKDVMQSNVPVIHKETSIKEASKTIIESDFTHIPVVEDGNKLAGILTAWDVASAVANDLSSLSPIMTTEVITASPEEPVKQVTHKINQYNISALPVVDESDEVLGLVTSDSITQLIQGQQPIPGTEEVKKE
ncbi:homoserine O-acetyltransferase [Candidatus Bipolaricaulota bacterium]|nr:homoserine O-acetyltransferase [Candidatus Bipolaricaulota bacterium]